MNNIKWCCDKIIKPLYSDIVYKDYWEPIKRLSKEYNNIFEDDDRWRRMLPRPTMTTDTTKCTKHKKSAQLPKSKQSC